MKQVKIIGVPEHFNLPWHMAIEEGLFADRGIELIWEDIPEGTGRMAKMLADKSTDLAIILTEGLVKSIADGNPASILQGYIASPLLWGIHVAAQSEFKSLSDLEHKKAAISRFGSGSHLMAYVNAQNQDWSTDQLQFNVVNNLDNAVVALQNGEADYFMWERFTTKPLVDKGVFRRIDDCPTPWPCFVIAGNQEFIKENQGVCKHILEVINNYTYDFKYIPKIDKTIANRYEQKVEDVKDWLSLTHWSENQLSIEEIKKVQNALVSLQLIETKKEPASYLAEIP